MKIILYRNTSDSIVVDKQLEEIGVYEGSLRGPCNIADPIITLTTSDNLAIKCNYAYIEEFGRYYHVKIRVDGSDRYTLNMMRDPLYTFRNSIRSAQAIINRQESTQYRNVNLQDDEIVTYQGSNNTVLRITTDKLRNPSYVLLVAS